MMNRSGKNSTSSDADVSFSAGTALFLIIFVLSNLYEGIFNRYLGQRFESVYAIYLLSLALMVIPFLVIAVIRRETFSKWAKSLNFGILLIIVVTAATIIGTLIFQNRMPQDYIDSYGQPLFRVFMTLHMIDLFHSVWFVNILFLLMFNIVYCYVARRELSLRNLGGYVLHFGIIVSLAGAFIGFVWGVKGVIQLNEGDDVDSFIVRGSAGPPRMSLGYDLVLDDFALEWYAPKYLLNTYHMTRQGGELVSSLNVEKKRDLTVAEADLEFTVLRFSEHGIADGIMPARRAVPEGMPPSPIISLTVEDESMGRMTRDEAKASGWLAAYDDENDRFTDVFDTDSEILFSWQKPPELVSVQEGGLEEQPREGRTSTHVVTYRVKGVKKSIEVEPGKAYRLEGTPYILRVTNYYPSFKIDSGVAYSSSDAPENPALSIEITDTEHPEVEYKTTYLFSRKELRGMMHAGGLPEGLSLEYELQGVPGTGGASRVFIVGEENRIYVTQGNRVTSESPIEFGRPVSFSASGHDLLLSVQELYRDEPLCQFVIRDGVKVDTLVISPLFSDPIRHRSAGYLSTFRRERDILDYKSKVRVLKDGQEVLAQTIEVNHPLSYGGFSIYQQNYNEVDWTWTGFEVVKDPGLWIVYLGFGMMCLGALYVFYVRPRIKK